VTGRYPIAMAVGESQYVRTEPVGRVVLAEVLREKITEHENHAVFNDLSAAAAKHGQRVALDLGQVGLLSSAGLGGLITLHKACAAKGGRLVVFGVQDQILSLLKLTHLDKLLTIAPSREAAVEKAGA
jgi:anti-sigma B factor antagonist